MSVVKLSIILAAAAWHDTADTTPMVPDVQLPPAQQRGLASWYGDGQMHGRRTASGEAIDPQLETCAHRTIPLNTTVLLVNSNAPERRVWCRVNDRGPFGAKLPDGTYVVKTDPRAPGRWRAVIDVSIAAARELGTYKKGLQPIEIHYFDEPGSAPIAENAIRRREE